MDNIGKIDEKKRLAKGTRGNFKTRTLKNEGCGTRRERDWRISDGVAGGDTD